MKKFLLFLFVLSPVAALTQNLSGTWEGSGGGVTYIKMVIRHQGDSVYGYTYDEGEGFCKATFAAKYSRPKKRLVGRGVKMLENSGTHGLAVYDLLYTKEPRGEFLKENIGEEGFLDRLFGNRSRQYLRKTSNKVDFPKKPPLAEPKTINVKPPILKKEPIKVSPPKTKPKAIPPSVPKIIKKESPVLRSDTIVKKTIPDTPEIQSSSTGMNKKKEERSTKLVETIYTTSDTIKMMVYDNGEVDGDTVTVFFDNAVILDRYRISEKAKVLYLPVSRNGQPHSIELFANNLGTIPPNTALIIIIAGNKRYELRASYDLQTNAKIIIQYRE